MADTGSAAVGDMAGGDAPAPSGVTRATVAGHPEGVTVTDSPTRAADAGRAAPLLLAGQEIWPPVVLAPMAGVTDTAYRTLCRQAGAGLCVSEMVTSRGLVEGSEKTRAYLTFTDLDRPRSVQLFGVDPVVMREAVAIIAGEGLADHVDINVGCPVPKVTRKGGGAALPFKRRLFRQVVRGAVTGAAGRLPVTVKMRKGIDDDHLTYLEAGRAAQEEGVAWVALHGRTAAQGYGGTADWDAIARLKDSLDVPVLGNGDVWQASDALDMMARTGCDGVVIGRGCLGRPWLFTEMAAAFAGGPLPGAPTLGEVREAMLAHARLELRFRGPASGVVQMRKHMAWYLQGFSVGSTVRTALGLVSTLEEMEDLLGGLDADQRVPDHVLGRPRGRTTTPPRVVLPDGWLDDPDRGLPEQGAESDVSGG